jgi:hypothetical protein
MEAWEDALALSRKLVECLKLRLEEKEAGE